MEWTTAFFCRTSTSAVYIGRSNDNCNVLDGAELYDPRTATWLSMAASKPVPNTYPGVICRRMGPARNAWVSVAVRIGRTIAGGG